MKYFFLQVPSDARYLELIRRFVIDICRVNNIPERETDDIELIVDETASNVVRHAYSQEQTGERRLIELEVEYHETRHEMIFSVADYGKGFSIKRFKSLQKKINERDPGGYGLHIIEKFSDKVEYSIHPNSKNVVTIHKIIKDT